MNAADIEKLLYSIGAHDRVRLRSNGWIESACPFATWRHVKGVDRHPSFAVRVVPNGTSRYRCHACGASGEIGASFLWKLGRMSGRNYKHLCSFVENTNAPSLADLSKRIALASLGTKPPVQVAGIQVPLTAVGGEEPELSILPDEELEEFTPDFPPELIEYLTSTGWMKVANEDVRCRMFTQKTLVEWELLWHVYARRITLPIRDVDGNLVAISGRAWPPKRKPKYLHTKGFRRDFYLYGEHRLVKGLPAILVEGQFDAVLLSQYGFVNVFALLGSYISRFQIRKLIEWCPSVRILPDGDDAGRKGAKVTCDQLAKRVPTTVLDVLSDGVDPGDLSEEKAHEVLGP